MIHRARLLAISSIFALSVSIVGCATTSGTGPNISQSGFDGARVVHINGHSNACQSFVCTGLGAQWNSKNPSETILIVHIFGAIKGITGAKLNIDGQMYDLQIMESFTNFSELRAATPESRKGFLVQTDLIRKVIASKRSWLRVYTTDGYMENAIIDGQTDSKAYHALKRFLTAVEQG